MSRKPSYPDDAPVEGAIVSQAAESAASAKSVDPNRKKNLVRAGVAVGIGSAAIVAALLYANRSRRNDK
ncbi:MAG: hypothetical protein H0W74_02315 [Sphingosinicella sp.]|nr:hypothetical protein [Sphingosinicella sp.]